MVVLSCSAEEVEEFLLDAPNLEATTFEEEKDRSLAAALSGADVGNTSPLERKLPLSTARKDERVFRGNCLSLSIASGARSGSVGDLSECTLDPLWIINDLERGLETLRGALSLTMGKLEV